MVSRCVAGGVGREAGGGGDGAGTLTGFSYDRSEPAFFLFTKSRCDCTQSVGGRTLCPVPFLHLLISSSRFPSRAPP